MRLATGRFFLFCIILQLPLFASAKDVYVSKGGNDAAAGTKDQPLATVEKAVEAMRGAGAGTIWIGAGEFYLKDGIKLGGKHGGTAQSPLVIRGSEPGKTRLCGSRTVKNLRPITPEEARPLISAEAKRHVLVADLAAQGFAPLAKLPEKHRAHGCEEVVFGDAPMQSARWPNQGFAAFTEVIDAGASGTTHWVQRDVYRPGSFRFPSEGDKGDGDKGARAKHWDLARGVWLHGFWCWDWNDEALLTKSYNAENDELRFAVKHHYGIGNPHRKSSKRRFYALHVFEELDSPGEYYLDRKNQKLYFWPPGDVTKRPVRITLCKKPLLAAEGVKYLIVRDLTFENGRGIGVQFRKCENCSVENCLVRNMGQSGMNLAGSNVSAIGCEVTGTSSYGIHISGGDRKSLTPGRCAVLNCHIHHVGRLNWVGGRGVTLHGCGNRMANNLIHHAPTGAVAYGGNEHVLELNEIHDVCIHYSDVGVFYTGRDWSSRGNIVRWNYIHDISNNAGHGSSAVYFDDCDSGDTALGNIVVGGVGRGVLLGGGRDNTIRGNIFIDLPVGIHVDARGPRGITLDRPGSWNLLDKCKNVDYLSPLWKKRYPKLARIMDEKPLMPLGNSIRDNIIIGCKKPFAISKGIEDAWLGRENNHIFSVEDVPQLGIEDKSKKLDLSKLPSVWKKVPGFPPIPLEKIGLSIDTAKCDDTPANRNAPNIVLILADDLGYGDLGCYGQEKIETPCIDRMAAEGMRFTDCYAGSTVCAPSRCSLMTGLHCGHTLVRGNALVPLRAEDVTVAEVLKAAGYTTAMFGKWGLGEAGSTGTPNRQGFDHWLGYLNQRHAHNYYPAFLWKNGVKFPLRNEVVHKSGSRDFSPGGVAAKKVDYSHDLFSETALEFLDKHGKERFFLFLPYTIPHANNEAGRVKELRTPQGGMEVPELGAYAKRDWPEPQKAHAAMITRLDRDVCRILDKLKQLGIDDNTLVIFTSDNGTHKEGGAQPDLFKSSGPLRGIKRSLHDGGIRVPMIVRWPGHIEPHTTSGLPCAFWDFLPTAADLANADQVEHSDGISIVPTLLGKPRQRRHEFLYWEFHEGGGSSQAVRMGHWKAVRKRLGAPLELYDLRVDIGEQNNVADNNPDVAAKIEAYLKTARTPSENWPLRQWKRRKK